MTTALKPRIRRGTPRRLSAVLVLLIASGLTALAWWLTGFENIRPLTTIVGSLLLIGGFIVAFRLARLDNGGPVALWRMISMLSPTALLMTVFPFIIDRIAETGQGLLILAVSVTIPWITSAANMPLYAPLRSVPRVQKERFYRCFYEIIPAIGGASLLLVAGFTAFMALNLDFGTDFLILYVVGVVSNIIFSYSLVPIQETQRFAEASLAWGLYAGTMLLAPQLWYIAPLIASVPGIMLSRRGMVGLIKPVGVSPTILTKLMVWGLLYGGVLWADKFVIIVLYQNSANILLLYVSLIPVVIAQSVYFTSQFEVFQRSTEGLWSMINTTPVPRIRQESLCLFDSTERELRYNFALAGGLAVSLILLSPAFGVEPSLLSLAFMVTPMWLQALMLVVLQLNQLKGLWLPSFLSLFHLLAIGVSIRWLPLETALLIIVLSDLFLMIVASLLMKDSFLKSAYELFWRRAISW